MRNPSHLLGNSTEHYKSQKIIINYQSQYPKNASIPRNLSHNFDPNLGQAVK